MTDHAAAVKKVRSYAADVQSFHRHVTRRDVADLLRAYDAVVEELDDLRGAYNDMRAMGLPDVATLRAQHAALVERVRGLAHDWTEAYSEEFFRPIQNGEQDVSRDRVGAQMGRHMAKILLATLGGAEGA
jgi:hypothetical protein